MLAASVMQCDEAVLILVDEPDLRADFELTARCLGRPAIVAGDGHAALACLRGHSAIALVVLDLDSDAQDGLETLRKMRRAGFLQPVVVVSGAVSTAQVVEAIRAGATNFLSAPVSHDDLRKAVQTALGAAPPASEISLTDSWMSQDLQAAWRRVAASDVPVLIEGETGTGKEVLARQIHAYSPRSAKPFLKLNCAALPSELVESELFGYERGAFTGAFASKPGKFEMAQGGTILLDEIGDMDVRLQAKLLHVLQDQECERLGGRERIPLDVRVMAATHCDLRAGMAQGRFRADLYYRLNVVAIRVPALRDRTQDICAAAAFFLRKHGASEPPDALLSPVLKQALLEYDWPGNLREMENLMRRLLVMQDPDDLVRQLLSNTSAAAPGGVIRFHPASAGSSFTVLDKVDEAKRKAETEAILRALDAARWNRKQAARILRVDYKALLYKMRKLDIVGQAHWPAAGPRPARTAGL